jgi:hypothetical protein
MADDQDIAFQKNPKALLSKCVEKFPGGCFLLNQAKCSPPLVKGRKAK